MGCAELHEIADVQMGHSFRSGIVDDLAGSVSVIQMKDLGENQTVTLESLARVDMRVSAGQQVRAGDIILRSRGDRATSAIVAVDPGWAVVAAPLLRIRVIDTRVLAAYLNWFINQSPAQGHFAKHAEGSRVKMISKRSADALEVEVPPVERQRAIVRVAELMNQARALQTDLETIRGVLLSAVMLNYARGGDAT